MKSQKGQSLVETALILPIILMLLFGIVDFGRIFHVYLKLDHLGREAARAGSVGEDPAIILVTGGLNEDNFSIEFEEGKITIELTYPVDFLTPIIGQVIGTIELENTTVMRVE